MTHVLSVIDKTGRKIHLSKERWKHIKQLHFDVTIEDIELALTKPTTIMPSDRARDARWYYNYSKHSKIYLMVSVKYLNGDGFVITAYYVDKIQ